ncbi:glycoside hydrolase [Fodinicola acaciae]|uniref:glycoside hydrolase n=1 Tax=Fodinicola acaciae TaxID=2681555 RepID=UPI0013D808E6|nr:glycoside hydrolase [Fodinicola acaciae]
MRRRAFLAASASVLAGTVPPVGGLLDASVAVDPRTSWGSWDGWGTSLCWWAKAFGTDDTLADLFFSQKTTTYQGKQYPGLAMTVVRYNAGACTSVPANGESMVVSPNIRPSRQMDGFWLDWNSADPASASWNWQVDANQRAMLAKAKQRGANRFELFSNSPMWWMCYNHNPSGSPVGITDNLQSWNYNQHAVYLATVAKYAHDHWGIDFESVEPFNEPASPWWTAGGTQEGCHFDGSTQQTVVTNLRNELNVRGLTNTIVAASDENTYDQARATWGSFSAQTRGNVGRINVHGYQQGNGRRDLLYQAAVRDGKKLWNSEYGENDPSGLTMASNLNLDMYWLHPTAWVYWQVLDGSNWGLVDADNDAGTTGLVQPKFFVLAQYSRHIRPGMRILRSTDVNTVAAYDPVARRLVLVATNYSSAQRISYDLSAFSTVGGGPGGLVRRWTTQTGGGDAYTPHDDITLDGKQFTAWFTQNTVQTFEIDNVVI